VVEEILYKTTQEQRDASRRYYYQNREQVIARKLDYLKRRRLGDPDIWAAERERKRKWARENKEYRKAYMAAWQLRRRNTPEAIARRECQQINLSIDRAIRVSIDLYHKLFKVPKLPRRQRRGLKSERERQRAKEYARERVTILRADPIAWAAYKAKRRQAERERLARDPAFKMRCKIRSQIYKALRGHRKMHGTQVYLGCTLDEFKQWIESKWVRGMSWDNYGRAWHIDHLVPQSYFDCSKEEELRRCFHFTNLRPLWARKNMRRGAKVGHVTPMLGL
jgi:hypothetical protein